MLPYAAGLRHYQAVETPYVYVKLSVDLVPFYKRYLTSHSEQFS